MREKYEYCNTVPRTWIVVIFSVKVSIFFLSYSKNLLLSIHMKNMYYYEISANSKSNSNCALTGMAFRREKCVMKNVFVEGYN